MSFRLILPLLYCSLAASQQFPGRIGVGLTERRLSAREAILKALESNLEIEVERANIAFAEAAIRGAKGAFDPAFRWLPGVQSRNNPTPSVLVSPDGKLSEDFLIQNFSLSQRVPWQGASLRLDFNNARQTTNNPFTSLTPFTNSQILLGLELPLLRNRPIDRDRAQIRIRSKQLDVSRTELELRTIDVITRAESAYWDLLAARENVSVSQEAVGLAEEQLGRTKRQIEAGTLAQVELAAADAELERRRDTLFASVALVTELENALKNLLLGDRKEELWNEAIVPEQGPPQPLPDFSAWRDAVADALSRRPELRQNAQRREQNDIELELNRNQTKPQANLQVGYSSAGLAGALNPVENPFVESNRELYGRVNQLSLLAGLPPLIPPGGGVAPPGFLGGYGQVLSNLFGGNFQSIQAGVSFDLTLRNRAAEAAVAQSVIAERRLKLQRQQLELRVETDVRNSYQALQSGQQRLAAATASVRAAKEKVESETRLFNSGESTNFLVLTRQNEYAESRRRELLAQLEINKSLAQLRRAAGRKTEHFGIQVR